LNVTNALGLEQKKGCCKDPAGTFFIDTDEDGIHISTDEYGKFIITSKKVAASIKHGTQGIYFIKQNKKGTYIRTDRYGDFYLEPEKLSKEEARERARQKAEWDEGNFLKNWEKHGVTASECEQIFFNRPLMSGTDLKHSKKESRYYALGHTDGGVHKRRGHGRSDS